MTGTEEWRELVDRYVPEAPGEMYLTGWCRECESDVWVDRLEVPELHPENLPRPAVEGRPPTNIGDCTKHYPLSRIQRNDENTPDDARN